MNTSNEKQLRYALLKSKLKQAINREFWFEACMIEYAIIEDRTSSILQHAGVCKNAYDPNKKLANKLLSIEMQIGKKHPIIYPKVSVDTISQIRNWKDDRNELVHRACISYDEDMARELATTGYEIVKAISNESNKVSRLANKIYEKTEIIS